MYLDAIQNIAKDIELTHRCGVSSVILRSSE